MNDLLVKPSIPDADGCVTRITPALAEWRYVGFEVYQLGAGQLLKRRYPEQEICLVVLSGTVDAAVASMEFAGLGKRASVFEKLAPAALYIPNDTDIAIHCHGSATVALCAAPGSGKYPPRRIDPGSMSQEVRGTGNNVRHVRNILPETEAAESLLVVEVVTPSGNWSSYPPHKHDTATLGEETALEETYYHRLDPAQGFAMQRVYTDDRAIDQTMTVEDGDVVMVPRGYHPVGVPHGYDLYYLNVMAGPVREWKFRNDPAHEWIAL